MNAALSSAAVVVRRTIAAPADVLFDAWLDPISLSQWMLPGGIDSTQARVDPRVGGEYEVIMRTDTSPIRHHGVYRAIERPRRLVFTWQSPPTDNRETLVTVDFIPKGTSTEIVVTHEQLPESALPSHSNGWTSALEKLAQFVGARPESRLSI
jgi:uncharacterized protein YndB with AHSA1/START domain